MVYLSDPGIAPTKPEDYSQRRGDSTIEAVKGEQHAA